MFIRSYDQLLRPERLELMREAASLLNAAYGIAMFEVHEHPEQLTREGKPISDDSVRIAVGGLWMQKSWDALSPLWNKMRELEAERQAKQ